MRQKAGDAPGAIDRQADFEIWQGQQPIGFFRPLNQANGLRVEVLAEPRSIPFFRVDKPV